MAEYQFVEREQEQEQLHQFCSGFKGTVVYRKYPSVSGGLLKLR